MRINGKRIYTEADVKEVVSSLVDQELSTRNATPAMALWRVVNSLYGGTLVLGPDVPATDIPTARRLEIHDLPNGGLKVTAVEDTTQNDLSGS